MKKKEISLTEVNNSIKRFLLNKYVIMRKVAKTQIRYLWNIARKVWDQ